MNQRPQNWEFVKGLVKEVHGVDVVWDGPLTETKSKIREIK